MTVHSLNNMQFGSITGYNSYRPRGTQVGGMLSYNNSIYGSGNNRNGMGSRFYNPGPMGTYVQFTPPEVKAEDNGSWWKTPLKLLGGFAIGWLLNGDNATKAGDWISKLFSGGNPGGTAKSSKPIDDNIFQTSKMILDGEMD